MISVTPFAVPLLYMDPPLHPVTLQVLRVTLGRMTEYSSPDYHVLLSDGVYKTCVFADGVPSVDLQVGSLAQIDQLKVSHGIYKEGGYTRLKAKITVVGPPCTLLEGEMWGRSVPSDEVKWKLQLLHCVRLLAS